jgi:hypothetical protein
MAGSRKQWRHPKAISEHAFDKLHVIDCTLAELETALDSAEVIDERELGDGTWTGSGRFTSSSWSTTPGERSAS